MNTINITIIVVDGIAAWALIIFLIWKDRKDKKTLNPDADAERGKCSK